MQIPLAKPWFPESCFDKVATTLRSGWVMQGPVVNQFERELTDMIGVEGACAVSSGTAALHLGLLAAGVEPGDVVLTASHSFIATANAVRLCGAEPLFVDIEEGGFSPTARSFEQQLSERFQLRDGRSFLRTDLIGQLPEASPLHHLRRLGVKDEKLGRLALLMPVHQIGLPAQMAPLVELAQTHKAALIEDSACALGTEVEEGGQRRWLSAPQGHFSTLSFHPRKLITTGEGGALLFSRQITATQRERVVAMRQHGIDSQGRFAESGYNYRLSDLAAALGVEQLHILKKMVVKRQELAALYSQVVEEQGLNGALSVYRPSPQVHWNVQSLPILLSDPTIIDKIQPGLIEAMAAESIEVRCGITNAHELPLYRSSLNTHLGESELRCKQSIFVPLYHDLLEADVVQVVKTLKKVLRLS